MMTHLAPGRIARRAFVGLLVLAIAGAVHDPAGDARLRSELSDRARNLLLATESLEKIAEQSSRPKPASALPATVPLIEDVHNPAFADDPSLIEGVTLESETTAVRASPWMITLNTSYTLKNTTAKPVKIWLYFDYCADDGFVVKRVAGGDNRILAPGEVKSGVERFDLTSLDGPITNVSVQVMPKAW